MKLRQCRREEILQLQKWLTNEETCMLWCAGRFSFPLTEEDLLRFYDSVTEERHTRLIAATTEGNQMIGFFLIRQTDAPSGSAHLGFIVINPEYRGHGYGKAMLQQALQEAAKKGVSRLTLAVFARNLAARRCYTALGFVEEDYQHDGFSYRGEVWPRYRMAIDLAAQNPPIIICT